MILRAKNILVLMLVCCTCFCVNSAFTQSKDEDASIDATVINSLEELTKSIYYTDPQKGVYLIDSLCNYYLRFNKTNEYYVAKIRLAHCYTFLQRDYQAINIYESCLKYFSQKKDSLRLYHIYTGIGNTYYNLKEERIAILNYNLACCFCNEVKYPHHEFLTLLNAANCYAKNNQFDTAFFYYKNAEKLLKFSKKKENSYRLRLSYAYAHSRSKQYKLAIQEANQALAYYRKESDVHSVMLGYEILGLSYLGLKNFKLAKTYIDSTAVLNNQFGSAKDSYDIIEDYYRIDTAMQDYKSANKHLLQMFVLNDSLYKRDKVELTSDLLIKYETERKEAEKEIFKKENEKRQSIITWQRRLIVLTVILSFLIICILFLYLRFRNKQQKKLAEKEKTASELKALKAQLNPHFIQNVFQIIANQVVINPTEVSVFLQKTSNYFRSVLNGSDKNVQSLEDEILFTEKYLQFQQSLFQNKLTYNIEVDNNIDSFDVMVPTMLLQPFIENSIKYGLQLSQQPTHITINFSKDETYLIISIIDNGVFASNATSVNDKSFGNALIAKRLNLFYKDAIHQPKLQSNALDDNLGFRVDISLPLKIV